MPRRRPSGRASPTLTAKGLLAGTKLSLPQIKEVLRCFAQRKRPAQAAKETGLSKVTIYRIYGHLRHRLCEIGYFPKRESFLKRCAEIEDAYDDWFSLAGFDDFMRKALGSHRGVAAKNKADYMSQYIFEFDQRVQPIGLYRIIIAAIRSTGPINRPIAFRKHYYLQEFMWQLGDERLANYQGVVIAMDTSLDTPQKPNVKSILEKLKARSSKLEKP